MDIWDRNLYQNGFVISGTGVLILACDYTRKQRKYIISLRSFSLLLVNLGHLAGELQWYQSLYSKGTRNFFYRLALGLRLYFFHLSISICVRICNYFERLKQTCLLSFNTIFFREFSFSINRTENKENNQVYTLEQTSGNGLTSSESPSYQPYFQI